MLVLIAIVISGVYIIQFFEQYNYTIVDSRLDDLSNLMLPDLEVHSDIIARRDQVANLIAKQSDLRFREELFVVVNNQIVASSANSYSTQASDLLDMELLLVALNGQADRTIKTLTSQGDQLLVMDKAYPIAHNGAITGVLYIRYDLKETNDAMNRARSIIIQSTVIGLSITMILGFIIAKNVTDPINDITRKAFKMARGDFDQYVNVRSDDEIGKLAEMFNHLTRRLKLSLGEISREKSKFEAIVNNIDDGLIAVTKFRKIIHINQKAVKILGEHDIVISEDYDMLAKQLPVALSYEQIIDKYPDWKGSELTELNNEIYQVRFEPFGSENDDKMGFIIVLQDVTESQRLETMRKEFVANVSHELKTPLTSIKSYAETLLDGALQDPEIAENFLSVINSEADRMSRLVRDLLQLSNFDANRTQMLYARNDWCELARAVVARMRIHIEDNDHQLVLDLPENPLHGEFDYDRIEQVLINLLSNAIKYTPQGGRIAVSVSACPKGICTAVQDSGIGIAKEDLIHIFERFYRVDKGRSRELGGTGLGLSIAKEIVERHGGKINIDSVVGQGTTISFWLPQHYTSVKPT